MSEDISKIIRLIEDSYLEYNVGDVVYSSIDSKFGTGKVLNWRLFGEDRSVEYLVSFGPGTSLYLCPLEISKEKPVDNSLF
jgi:hypothetical protein